MLSARICGRRVDPVTAHSYHVDFMPPPADVAARCIQRPEDREEARRNRNSIMGSITQSIIEPERY